MKISNIKLKIIFSSLFVVMLLIFPKIASAHTLKVDGTFGVTVHIDPDDAPKAQEQSTIFVSIKDRSGKFDEKNPQGCDCMLTILKDGKELTQLPIVTGNTYKTLSYTFPQSGSYDLVVTGKGKTLDPFGASFSYYVSGENTDTFLATQNPLWNYFPFVIVIVGFVILLMFLNPFKK